MQSYQLGQRFTTTGVPLNGGKAYFYLTTTTTPENVFDDPALGGGNAYSNPVVADSSGFFPELVYLDPSKTYRCVIKTSAGVTISDADPINTPQSGGGIDGADIDTETIPATALVPGAVEDALGYTPADEVDLNVVQVVTTALTGMVAPFITTSAPTGWVKANGSTIGDASSGATRANADTANLFALIWALDATNFPITDSVGGASTRGASAAADFALHKRLPLPDLRAEFIRGLDDSRGVDTAVARVVGSAQAGQLAAHTHTVTGGNNGASSTYITTQSNTASPGVTTSSTGGTENSSENRPRNISLLYCVKL